MEGFFSLPLDMLGVAGGLNAVTAPQLKERLKKEVEGGHGEVVVGLGRTSFMDSSGWPCWFRA